MLWDIPVDRTQYPSNRLDVNQLKRYNRWVAESKPDIYVEETDKMIIDDDATSDDLKVL